MKVLPFRIPKLNSSSFLVQEEKLGRFYAHLHRHPEIQVYWIRSGEGSLFVETSIFPFSANDLFVIASNKAHLFKEEGKSPIEVVSLFFSIDPSINPLMNVPELGATLQKLQNLRDCNKLDDLSTRKIGDILQLLLNAKSVQRLGIFIDLLLTIVVYLEADDLTNQQPIFKEDDRIKNVVEYTLQNFAKNITVTEIANQLSYTPEAFCRFFKKRTNKTYIEYLTEVRVSEVCNLLIRNEDLSIAEAAFTCGFNNISHFNRVFKKVKHQSPSSFMKSYYL